MTNRMKKRMVQAMDYVQDIALSRSMPLSDPKWAWPGGFLGCVQSRYRLEKGRGLLSVLPVFLLQQCMNVLW